MFSPSKTGTPAIRVAASACKNFSTASAHSERNPFGYGSSLRSEEHTSELQSHSDLVCRLLLEKKKKKRIRTNVQIIADNAYDSHTLDGKGVVKTFKLIADQGICVIERCY